MEFIISKLTSRKFWVAIAGAVYFGLNGDVAQMLVCILTYLGVEGAIDLASKVADIIKGFQR
jgi:hypothetical protein